MIKYEYSPGLCDKLRHITVWIYKDFTYTFKINWYKRPEKGIIFSEEYGRSLRRKNIIQDHLPKEIERILKELVGFSDFNIKTFYPELTEERKKEYTPLDVRHEYYTFNIRDKEYVVNVSPYIFDEKFLVTDQELLFLSFHRGITKWTDEVHEELEK